MSAVDLFADFTQWTVNTGGTTAPAAGSTETLVVASAAGAPAASNTAVPPTQFRIVDTADTHLPPEIMLVTNVAGTSWSVTRGAEGGVPWAHAAGWTAVPVPTAASFTQLSAIARQRQAPTRIATRIMFS